MKFRYSVGDIKSALSEINPDICIEFRQRYIVPGVMSCGNMLRVSDCPADLIKTEWEHKLTAFGYDCFGKNYINAKKWYIKKFKKISKKPLTKRQLFDIIICVLSLRASYGGIAQLARAFGSYPKCHWFKSGYRYQYGSLVKWLRLRPLTAATGVRIP